MELNNPIKKYKQEYQKINKDMNDLSLKFDNLLNTFECNKILNSKLQAENKDMKIKIKELIEENYKNKIDNN